MLNAICYNLLWFGGGFVTGVASFGANLFAVPFVALLLPPRESILLGCISGTAVFAAMSAIYARHIRWGGAALLTAGALAGIPLGVWALAHAGPRALLLGAAVCLGAFLFWQWLPGGGRRPPVGRWLALPLGVASGAMMSALGMGGPALVAYAYLRKLEKEATLGTVNVVSVAIMAVALPWQYMQGLYDGLEIGLGLWGAVFACCGIAVGIPLVRRMDVRLFRKVLLTILALSAVMLLVRGLRQ